LRALIYRTVLTVSAGSGICYNTAIGPVVIYCHERGLAVSLDFRVVNLGLPSVAPQQAGAFCVSVSLKVSCF